MKFVIVTFLLVFDIGVFSAVVIDATAFNSTKDSWKHVNVGSGRSIHFFRFSKLAFILIIMS